MATTEWDSVGKKEYSSWLNLANYTNISKCILDRWIYCNQEQLPGEHWPCIGRDQVMQK